jgi:hypothetical protein
MPASRALFAERACRAVADFGAIELNQPLQPSALDHHGSNLGGATVSVARADS